MVLDWRAFDDRRMLLTGRKAVWGGKGDFMAQLEDVEAFYLVDCLPPVEYVWAKIIITCSPEDQLEWDFANRGVTMKALPPWTFRELREARGLYPHASEDDLSSAFDLWGGDANRVLREARTSFPGGVPPDLSAVRRALQTFCTRPGDQASVSLRLIPDADLKFLHYDLPSMHVAEQVVASAYASDRMEDLKAFLASLGGERLFRGVRMSLWRALVLH